jgi:aldehyde dehydrogenase (NAD+)
MYKAKIYLCNVLFSSQIIMQIQEILSALGVNELNAQAYTGLKSLSGNRETKEIFSPVDAQKIAAVYLAAPSDYQELVSNAETAFDYWKRVPAPKRGEIVRQYGDRLRKYKTELGMLVSYEMGKSLQEGWGEVQEMIDICDFAVGLSRQLHGLTMHSERPMHRMYEQWHPLGIVGIISAFNFPVAVWSWNAMIAAVCGNVCLWKPSEKTPLTAIACQHLLREVLERNSLPEGIFNLIIGDRHIGELMASDTRIPLVSATGSTAMGKKVGAAVGARLGRHLLELGGNNAVILTPQADPEMAVRAVVFGAVGTCGQRCTSTRRLIIHESIYEKFRDRLLAVYPRLKIGNPLEEGNIVGPLIDKEAVGQFLNAVDQITKQGGKILYGGTTLEKEKNPSGCYVIPCIAEAENSMEIVQQETFAPLLYLMKYRTLEEAIRLQNGVRQGLSSAIFTGNLNESEEFLSHWGSDCGIANVNIGTSGAEIGGAFGGEKDTGGGRESGSDAWKAYMRRQTNTINYGNNLPLAQGITFDL